MVISRGRRRFRNFWSKGIDIVAYSRVFCEDRRLLSDQRIRAKMPKPMMKYRFTEYSIHIEFFRILKFGNIPFLEYQSNLLIEVHLSSCLRLAYPNIFDTILIVVVIHHKIRRQTCTCEFVVFFRVSLSDLPTLFSFVICVSLDMLLYKS